MDRVDYQSIVIQDILNLDKSDELDLSPWYQRRSVWNTSQKAFLINTLLEKKPIPAIYVRHSIDLEKSKSIREVVDGQQRCRTILEYCEDEFPAKHPLYEKKLKFSDLTRHERQEFLLTSIPTGFLLGATDGDVVEIFARINSISKTLNSQEKRNAKFSGEMKQLCLKQASSRIHFWRQCKIFTANSIARMDETLFVSDVVYNLLHGLSDYSSAKLDNMYKDFDESFPKASNINKRLDRIFDLLVAVDPHLLSDTIFSRTPVLFSLCIVIDQTRNVTAKKLEKCLLTVDERYNSTENRTKADNDFVDACSASTQRISNRRLRDKYIRQYLK